MKRVLSFLLIFAVIITYAPVMPVTANAVASGTCGDSLTWTLDDAGTLTISGTGAMEDYASASVSPWYNIKDSIKQIVIENGITSIGDRAFCYCTELSNISIGNDISKIGAYAFRGCSLLPTVTIPASVTQIADSAFRTCSLLATVVFEGNAPVIGSYVFTDCDSSITVKYYENATGFDIAPWTEYVRSTMHVGEWIVDAEASCTQEGSRHITCTVCGNTDTEVIPFSHNFVNGICTLCGDGETVASGNCGNGATWKLDTFGTLTISGIGSISYGDASFVPWYPHREKIIKVVIQEGITTVGRDLFWDCTKLTSVTIPSSVTSIGYCAFQGCHSLAHVYITDIAAWCRMTFDINSSGGNPLNMANNLYLNGKLITDLVIPEGVTRIAEDAFTNCNKIINVTIPESVSSIGYGAFSNCSRLKKVSIGDGVTSIPNGAFRGCKSLTSFTIPESVTSIGYAAFESCSSLTSVTIPDSVTNIGDYVFDGCGNLRDVYYKGSPAQKTKITIGHYNTSLTSATWHYAAPILHKQGNIEAYYTTLEKALTAATNGTIVLFEDVTAESVSINSGATLDLNGHTLTADSVSGKVMDSADGEGLIKVNAQSAVLSSNDDQLILWDNATDNAGYRAFRYTFTNMGLDAHQDDASESAKYGATVKSVWSDLVFTNSYAYTLVSSTYSGLQVGFELSWTPDGGETASKTFNFAPATLEAWGIAEEGNTGAENYCFYLRITGFEELLASGIVTVKPIVKTAFNSAETKATKIWYDDPRTNPGGLEYKVGFGIIPEK